MWHTASRKTPKLQRWQSEASVGCFRWSSGSWSRDSNTHPRPCHPPLWPQSLMSAFLGTGGPIPAFGGVCTNQCLKKDSGPSLSEPDSNSWELESSIWQCSYLLVLLNKETSKSQTEGGWRELGTPSTFEKKGMEEGWWIQVKESAKMKGVPAIVCIV